MVEAAGLPKGNRALRSRNPLPAEAGRSHQSKLKVGAVTGDGGKLGRFHPARANGQR